jgi:hypothetical protein
MFEYGYISVKDQEVQTDELVSEDAGEVVIMGNPGRFKKGRGRFKSGRDTQTPTLKNLLKQTKAEKNNNSVELTSFTNTQLKDPSLKLSCEEIEDLGKRLIEELETWVNVPPAPKGVPKIRSIEVLKAPIVIAGLTSKIKTDVNLGLPWKLKKLDLPEKTPEDRKSYVTKMRTMIRSYEKKRYLPEALKSPRRKGGHKPRPKLAEFTPVTKVPDYMPTGAECVRDYDPTDPLGLKKLP